MKLFTVLLFLFSFSTLRADNLLKMDEDELEDQQYELRLVKERIRELEDENDKSKEIFKRAWPELKAENEKLYVKKRENLEADLRSRESRIADLERTIALRKSGELPRVTPDPLPK